VVELTQALYLNGKAIQEGPKRKSWSRHDIKHIKPLTPAQEEMFQDFMNGNNVFAHGSAGTGKSFVGLYLALNEMLQFETEIDRVIIVRSAVPARDVGFLPGTLEEKNAVYEQPYKDILADLFGKSSTYEDMKTAGKLEFVTTSFIRGMTWDNAVIVFDEVQNANWEEINTVMTRIGEGSRIILCGDVKQNDLLYKKMDKTGVTDLLKVCEKLPAFTNVTFTRHDIVRSDFVKQFIIACEDLGL
jgi:phosphate starvation-inducible PhoH-like protein